MSTVITVIVGDTETTSVEQSIHRDQYTVELAIDGKVHSLDPEEARAIGINLLSAAFEPDRCTGGRDEGECDHYVPCDIHPEES